ncbi:MAG: 3-phosphoglycerate dehydrogenase family protein [Phycisphaerales bacterium]
MPTTASTPSANAGAAPVTAGTRVLVADKLETSAIEGLKAFGCQVTQQADVAPDGLGALLAATEAEVLVVRSRKVDAKAIEQALRLGLIVRAGAGYDTIDVAAASRRGIFVANCPGKNSMAVAELAWALILSADRRVPDQVAQLRAGQWNKKEYSAAQGLFGRTLGIVGLGQIGQEIAKRGRAFGMEVVAWSRNLTEARAEAAGAHYCSNIVNLAKIADVVSVSVAANEETSNLIGEKFFHAMKPNSIFVNTSRGSVVDQAALTAAIREKKLRAGLDVFAKEPSGGTGTFEDPIVKEPGVYGTHHVGASTEQAQQAVAAETVRIIRAYVERGQVPNCVNRAASTPATTLLSVRHLNRPGVLAHVFYTLGQSGINVEEMENIIYEGAEAALARIQLDSQPSEEHLAHIRRNPHVLAVSFASLPGCR